MHDCQLLEQAHIAHSSQLQQLFNIKIFKFSNLLWFLFFTSFILDLVTKMSLFYYIILKHQPSCKGFSKLIDFVLLTLKRQFQTMDSLDVRNYHVMIRHL